VGCVNGRRLQSLPRSQTALHEQLQFTVNTGPEVHTRSRGVTAYDDPTASCGKLVDAMSQCPHDPGHDVWWQGGFGNRERRSDRNLALDQFLEQVVGPAIEQVPGINVFELIDTGVEHLLEIGEGSPMAPRRSTTVASEGAEIVPAGPTSTITRSRMSTMASGCGLSSGPVSTVAPPGRDGLVAADLPDRASPDRRSHRWQPGARDHRLR
jgi:hypothetical protein